MPLHGHCRTWSLRVLQKVHGSCQQCWSSSPQAALNTITAGAHAASCPGTSCPASRGLQLPVVSDPAPCRHLRTAGTEGLWPACRVYLNPGAGERRLGIASSPWAAQEGQDFLANNVVPDIDFATTHIWMDNWMGYGDFSTCIPCDLNFDYSHGACPALPPASPRIVPAWC